MESNKLKLNLSKTAIITFPPTVAAGPPPQTTIDTNSGQVISKEHLKLLGIVFHRSLTWTKHMNTLVSQLSHKLAILRQMSLHASTKTLRQVASGIILGRIQYGITVYGHLPLTQQHRLQTLLLTAARICLGPTYNRASTSALLGALKWPSVNQMVELSDTKLLHQALVSETPQSLHSRISRPMGGATREAARGSLIISRQNKHKHKQTITQIGMTRYNGAM